MILGGGRRHWLPRGTKDPEQTTEDGRRLDGRNLVEDWLRDSRKRDLRAEYVINKEQLEAVDLDNVNRLLGEDSCVLYLEAKQDTATMIINLAT